MIYDIQKAGILKRISAWLLDFIVLLTDEKFAELEEKKTISECIGGYCTYEQGYFDIKYQTKDFLADVAEKGSEPARNAFLGAKCIFTRDPEIPAMVERAQVFDTSLKEEKMLSFYAQFLLNKGYYWEMSRQPKDIFLRVHTASEIVLYGLRMLLEEKEVFFPCPKSLYLTVERLEDKPQDILAKADRLLRELSDEAKAVFYKLTDEEDVQLMSAVDELKNK